jgi:hypothetical protein
MDCGQCHDTEAEAINAWNRRATLPVIKDLGNIDIADGMDSAAASFEPLPKPHQQCGSATTR